MTNPDVFTTKEWIASRFLHRAGPLTTFYYQRLLLEFGEYESLTPTDLTLAYQRFFEEPVPFPPTDTELTP